MQLVVLGSGTSVPHPERASAAHWLQTSSGSLLLDCSAAAGHRMAQEGLDWANLDAIWISHFHLDHVGGLAPLLFGTKHAPQTQARRKPLVAYGPHGLAKLFQAFDAAHDHRLTRQPFAFEIREVAPNAAFAPLPHLRAETFATPHTDESLALKLTDEDGATLVYTSDTGPTDALAEFARGVELLFMECSFWRDKPLATHLELAEAMRLAAQAEPRRVLLAHLYPQWDGVDLAAEARKLWPGETIAAYDGLRLTIAPA
ncbi:MAG TPA: MBL fold metallo-hydrolase [Pyrinomonadaceae bacterium]|jgi:ribonuclease BN (tRNA processing enzyme)|nr:MBL fold metallo-hydrolase [Pyrinomonadaceae bacterium]